MPLTVSHSRSATRSATSAGAAPPVAALLRLEALLALGLAVAAYLHLGFSWWLAAALILAPDLSGVGYVWGPRAGAWAYDLAHTYVSPALLAGLGYAAGVPVLMALAAIWAAHIAIDRVVGYGLKFAGGAKDTHLSRLATGRRPASGPDAAHRDHP
ncbi:MAG: DUF4260 family protein [Devosia sp.]|nr:DUF4260 family protein [Devosia sp.]